MNNQMAGNRPSEPGRKKCYPSDVTEAIAKIRKDLDRDKYGHLSDISLGMLHRSLTSIEMTFETMMEDHDEEFMTIEKERQSHLRPDLPSENALKLIKVMARKRPTFIGVPNPPPTMILELEAKIKASAREITDDAIELARLQIELRTALEGCQAHEEAEECKSTGEEVQSTDRDSGSED